MCIRDRYPPPPTPAPLPTPAPPSIYISFPVIPAYPALPSYPLPAPPSILTLPSAPPPKSLSQFNQLGEQLAPVAHPSTPISSASGLTSGIQAAIIAASVVGGLVVIAALAGLAYVGFRSKQRTWAPRKGELDGSAMAGTTGQRQAEPPETIDGGFRNVHYDRV